MVIREAGMSWAFILSSLFMFGLFAVITEAHDFCHGLFGGRCGEGEEGGMSNSPN